MDLQFVRSCQEIGNSKGVIIPKEVLAACGIDTGDKVVIKYYEKTKEDGTKKKYFSGWKEGE